MNEELKAWILDEYRKGVLEGIRLGTVAEEDRIINTIDSFIDNSDDPNVAQYFEWLKVSIKGENK
jgi:hypothetical protein